MAEQEKSLEMAFSELDVMLEKLADRDVSLEESFAVYAEGMKLLKYCDEKIDRVEKQVLKINEVGELDEF